MSDFIPKPGMVVYNDTMPEKYLIVEEGLDYVPPYDYFWAERVSDGCLHYHRYNNHVEWKIENNE